MKKMVQSALIAFVMVLVSLPAEAAGELMVHPTRLVLEGNARTAQIDLINSGTEPATYRISVIRRRMAETGDFIDIEEPAEGEQFADDMIRFSPRQVVLQPGVAQAVRLQIRKPSDLAEGEYRSHLLFQALPSSTAPSAAADGESDGGVEIRLIPIYSLSIPVIVRHGTLSADVSISELAMRRSVDGVPALGLTIHRSGTRSVYGDLTVYLMSNSGVERVVGRANGVAIYTPNALRRALVPLPALAAGIPSGVLRVVFSERPEQTRRVEAEARISVP